ncbi:hypothetical protein ACFFU1_17765 [Algibacter miyuki]|uniref:Uncharacterized protein n=1 Tax=Algibacter miyuki TaxID=1306933 RepID=A0ABV5H651_9FLAO|nr:hypothetical protein [Algibacter miyuki]MDN3663812.1 hypothetical protein [Algibacter miyuki]
MSEQFTIIAKITIKHSYFKNGVDESAGFYIERKTSKLLENLGLIVKFFSGGFYILASNLELLESVSWDQSLQFNFSHPDMEYINYTELGNYQPSTQLLYFSNFETEFNSENEQYILHNTDFVGTKQCMNICFGTIEIPNFDATKSYIFKTEYGEEIPWESVEQSASKPAVFYVALQESCVIHVFSDNIKVLQVYYSTETMWRKPLGIVTLFPRTLLEHVATNEMVNYTICFKSRETYWKYFLVNEAYKTFEGLSIINKDKKSIFKVAQRQNIINHSEVIVFESINKLPLLEYYNDNLQLVSDYNPDSGSGKIVIKKLPFASPAQIFIQEPHSDDENYYSHIYF